VHQSDDVQVTIITDHHPAAAAQSPSEVASLHHHAWISLTFDLEAVSRQILWSSQLVAL